jgi:hypothetical protein
VVQPSFSTQDLAPWCNPHNLRKRQHWARPASHRISEPRWGHRLAEPPKTLRGRVRIVAQPESVSRSSFAVRAA